MEKIDRLGWTGGLIFLSHGLRIGLRTNQPEVLDRFLDYLPPGWKYSRSQSPIVQVLYSLKVGGEGRRPNTRLFTLLYYYSQRIVRSMQLDDVFDKFETSMRFCIATRAPRRVFLHAGVVGWRGQAIVIPGRSLSGKTALVAELVKQGATYYSDEFAVLDTHGHVHPFATPLGMRDENDETLPQQRRPVESLGGRAGVTSLPVGLIVASEYKPGGRWRPRQLSAGTGALTLFNNAVSSWEKPEAVMSTLRKVVLNAPVLKGARGEAKDIVNPILKYLD